jgi:hypothetical protein
MAPIAGAASPGKQQQFNAQSARRAAAWLLLNT